MSADQPMRLSGGISRPDDHEGAVLVSSLRGGLPDLPQGSRLGIAAGASIRLAKPRLVTQG